MIYILALVRNAVWFAWGPGFATLSNWVSASKLCIHQRLNTLTHSPAAGARALLTPRHRLAKEEIVLGQAATTENMSVYAAMAAVDI